MSFTGAADRVDASGGFGQGETRPQAFTGLDGKGYLIGRTQDRIIEIADISDPDTSTYVSAIIGNPNSMAAHNGSLYVFIGRDLIRFDTPFSDTDTGTDIFTINETPRALTSDGTNLYYIHQNSTLNFLYRIDDLDGTPTAVSLGRVGSSANIRGFVWHDGFFWGVDATTDRLVKIILTTDSNDPHTVENVGSFSQFVGPLTNPQGLGVVNGVGYVSALDNDGSLWELNDFKFTADIDDQEWTVGTAVSVSAPTTEDGATPITYAISPALPAGVALDTSTGGISGTPTATTDATDYTLTATDDNEIEATTTFSASVAASVGTLTPPTFTAPASDYEVDERDDATIDSTEFFTGHTSLAFDSGYTAPSWVTISGLNVVITDAPDVTDETDYDIELTATNDDGDVDGTITVSVQQIDSAPVIGTLSRIDVNEGASKTVDVSASLQNTDDLVITSSQSWVSISGLSLVITNAPSVTTDTDYTVNLRVESDATSETDTGSVVIRVADVPAPVVNTPPEFSLSSYIFSDVAIAVNTVVGTVAAIDADNDTLSYSLTGTDASKFDIDSDGEITAAEALNYDKTYNITVVADDSTDTASVGVTIHTETLSLPKILLFKKQLNRITTPAVAGDNDYSTYTDADTVTISIDQAGVAQMFDTLFLKMMNVTSYVVEVDGVALPARTVPQNLTGVTELGDVSVMRHGYQHDLYEVSPAQSGSTVEITLTGTNIRVSEVWVLKKIAALQKLKQIAHSQIDRDSTAQQNVYGYDETDVNTGLDRLRWRSEIELEFTHTDENYEVFLDLIEDHAEAGIVVAQEPRRLPWRMYQAIFSNLSHAAPYLCEARPAGNTVQFVIDETREAGPLWYSMDTFNSNDSGDGLMFFRNCTHLFENGAVDDNDYETHSTETTHTFDVEAVSHIFLKATGVTSYQVQTLVSNAWATQETITPTQKAYRGYDNSLTKLTTRLAADRVRLVFTGSNIEIYAVMCLDRGGEILTDTQSLLSKTDRTGIIHEGQGGGLERARVLQSQRMKWGIDVRATFGHFDDFIVDDVLDWINAYPNFVFSYLPKKFPWRTFPATWTDQRFQQAFLTTILQNGDYLQMNVKER